MTLNVQGLIDLADRLDKAGKHKEASKLDELIKKAGWVPEEVGDEEFKGKLQEEGFSPDVKVHTYKMDENKVEPNPKEIAPQEGGDLSAGLKAELSKLIEKGWYIFAPGEFEAWMNAQRPDIHPEDINSLLENLEAQSAINLHSLLKTAEPLLPQYSPGAFDLNSPHRMKPVSQSDIKKELYKVWPMLPEDAQEDISSKIEQYLSGAEEEKPATDESVTKSIQDRDKMVLEQAGLTEWPENEAYRLAALKRLAGLADRLDKIGAVKEANLVDEFIQKYATDVERKPEADTEQAKRYDSKHHHSLQIREPKTEQERVDREGRKTHHVHTYQNDEGKKKEASLSTRYCPKHIGVMMTRVGENTYQCPTCHEVYNWETGWTDFEGTEHPGGSVAAQTPDSSGYATPHRIFDSRENITNKVN